MACVTRSIRAILSLVFALVSGAVFADWMKISPDNGIYSAFADKDSIRRNGSVVTMHGLYDFKRQDYTPEGRGLYSTAVLREYDCAARRVRLMSAIDFAGHMGAGEAVSTSSRIGRWETVIAGGIDDAYLSVACGAQ
jgi:hypothetical protein